MGGSKGFGGHAIDGMNSFVGEGGVTYLAYERKLAGSMPRLKSRLQILLDLGSTGILDLQHSVQTWKIEWDRGTKSDRG